MWNQLIGDVKNVIPKFNDYLLTRYRKEKIEEIIHVIDYIFKESITLFNTDSIKYVGYEILTPDERVDYIMTNKIKRSVNIKYSTAKLVRFKFEFEKAQYTAYIELPYMENDYYVVSNGAHYFPQFPIVEKGCRFISRNEIKITPKKAILSFFRYSSNMVSLQTLEGIIIRDIKLACRIHQGAKRQAKKTIKTPLLIYMLAYYGLAETLRLLGFKEHEFQLVNQPIPDKNYLHVKIKDNIFVRIHNDCLLNLIKTRFIVSFVSILNDNKKFNTINELTDNKIYWIVTLGMYTYPNAKKNDARLLYSNAVDHLEYCKILLDIPTRQQLSTIGINVNDLFELLVIIFINIDKWINEYNPSDLFMKKIGTLSQLVNDYTKTVFKKQFQLISNKKKEFEKEAMTSFVNTASKGIGKYVNSAIFKSNPTICNDNWLLSIGCKKTRSQEDIEKKNKTKKDNKPSLVSLKAHPSQLIVESIVAIPSSNTLISGSINPYLEIDSEGNIIPPENIDKLNKVFKCI